MSIVVQNILKQIEELSSEDRLVLERQLNERANGEWRKEAEVARKLAAEKGISQEQIDRAIEKVRYSE